MSRAEKKQRAREREERARQRVTEEASSRDKYREVQAIQAQPQGKSKKKSSSGKIFLKTFFIAFVVLTAGSLGITSAINKVSNFNPFDAGKEYTPVFEEELQLESLVDENSPFFQSFKDSKRANILLLGVNGGLTDTIMLVSFDMDNKQVDVISVPRDTYYQRRGYNGLADKKLNAAYRGNPVNTAKAVSKLLCGMPINYYAVIKYDGVEKIVDSMGGVPMDVPNINNKGGMYYTDPYDKPPLKIALKAGPQTLNGKQAVQFLRFRHGYAAGDLGRVNAQQEFMKSAFRQCIGLNLPAVAKTVFQNVDSDITLGTALKLSTKAVGISGESIKTYTLPNTLDPDPPFYVYPDREKTEEMIKEIYSVQTESTTESAVTTD
ncbi:LCP family protein [Aminipila luticellarii]|uniref:LytR family transcriptional regulator n=1 Tax=Aminipila luticellarii TaxID=2507160 RepID=A0A410PSN8_9FIRM|nr:LCP family protein [Aminipila luticellarii]QAT41934.1 LytR family transcriptional regulator [Aminipila luticellarii]